MKLFDAGVVLPVMALSADAMERGERFAAGYRSTVGELPEAGDPDQFQPVIARFTSAAATLGMSEREAYGLAEAWFTDGKWVQPVLYLAQRKEVRAALPDRERLTVAAEAVREQISAGHQLYGLLRVLDDEPLTVLHRPTGRGYRVAISGIGDNFQLHTLLAVRLIGDPPPYRRECNAARAYPLMRPTLNVDRILTAGEAARWLSVVKPPQR